MPKFIAKQLYTRSIIIHAEFRFSCVFVFRIKCKCLNNFRTSLVFGNRLFRTQVISYPSHFVPFWSFRTHFYFQYGHFVPSLVISYLLLLFSRKPLWSLRTYSLLFRTQIISYPKSFRTHFSHFVPTSKPDRN